ncbi:hypothetical protein AOLI_G00166600 [Acnodon oligacanthus]
MPNTAHPISSIVEGIMEMGTGRGVQVALGWRRRRPAAPCACATAICHQPETSANPRASSRRRSLTEYGWENKPAFPGGWSCPVHPAEGELAPVRRYCVVLTSVLIPSPVLSYLQAVSCNLCVCQTGSGEDNPYFPRYHSL